MGERVIEVKPVEWDTPIMKTDLSKEIIKKLEDYYKRPMFGAINIGGIECLYADPAAVTQLFIKLNKQEKILSDEINRIEALYKAITGFDYE